MHWTSRASLIFLLFTLLFNASFQTIQGIPPMRKTLAMLVDWFDLAWNNYANTEGDIENFVKMSAEVGFSEVYWRVSVIGTFAYWTRIERTYQGDLRSQSTNVVQALKSFDPLAAAVRYGHKYGLKVYPWIAMYDEGFWPPESSYANLIPPDDPSTLENESWSLYTLFAREHLEYLWETRTGKKTGRCLSLAYPEVRNYRMALIKELIDYGVDGLFLDFCRWPINKDTQTVDYASGACIYGYEEPLLTAYKEQKGVDPRQIPNKDPDWIRFRAEHTNEVFLMELKQELNHLKLEGTISPRFEVVAQVYYNPEYSLKAALQDWKLWAKEKLVDTVSPMLYGLYPQTEFSPMPEIVYNWTQNTKNVVEGNCKVVSGLGCFQDQLTTPKKLSEATLKALQAGADGVAIFEAANVYPKFGDYHTELALKELGMLTDIERLLSWIETEITGFRRTLFTGPTARAMIDRAEEECQRATQELEEKRDAWPHALKALEYLKDARSSQELFRKTALVGVTAIAAMALTVILYRRLRKASMEGRRSLRGIAVGLIGDEFLSIHVSI